MPGVRDIGLVKECTFKTSRSSGSGGQHVNKVETRVVLHFNVQQSRLLTEEQKNRINSKLVNRINKQGELVLSSQRARSQLGNKKLVVERFFSMLEKSLVVPRKRKATKPSAAARRKRLQAKREQSEKKQRRAEDKGGEK